MDRLHPLGQQLKNRTCDTEKKNGRDTAVGSIGSRRDTGKESGERRRMGKRGQKMEGTTSGGGSAGCREEDIRDNLRGRI